MLSTYTWGTAPYNYAYNKQYAGKGIAKFSVSGLTPDSDRSFTVSYQTSKDGTERSMFDVSRVMPVPGSTTGATKTARCYTVLVRPSFMTDAEAAELIDANRTVAANAGFVTSFLNQETP